VAIIDHGRVIDVGTPAALVRRHCPERTVVVTTGDPSAAEVFGAIPGIDAVDVHGAELSLRGRGDGFVTHVIQCLADHRIAVTDFRTESPTLEDVFLRVTGHALRN
jgi:ABC-2 type transport system ATP-binding protein